MPTFARHYPCRSFNNRDTCCQPDGNTFSSTYGVIPKCKYVHSQNDFHMHESGRFNGVSDAASHPHQTHAHNKTSHTIVAPASDCIIRDGCFVSCWHSQSPSTDFRTCRTSYCLHCWWPFEPVHTRPSSVLTACTRDQQSCT